MSHRRKDHVGIAMYNYTTAEKLERLSSWLSYWKMTPNLSLQDA